LADGSHQFEVRAVNIVGERDSSPAVRNWGIDTVPPDTTLMSGPDAVVSATSATFNFGSADPAATFECSLDGSSFAACTPPQTYSALTEGQHSFAARAVDPLGNRDLTPARLDWTISFEPPPPPPPPHGPKPRRSHVFVVVMENKEYGEVIGSSAAPYLNALAQRYTSLTDIFGIRHPSLPNYLALIGGSTFGITSNCTGCSARGQTLVNQMTKRHLSWNAYLEDAPKSCFRGTKYRRYVKRHNPFVYFPSITRSKRLCGHLKPGRTMSADLRSRKLANLSWIVPNMCNSTHDCSVRQGDRYLRRLVPRLLRRVGPQGFVLVTYDEGSSGAGCCGLAQGGHIPTVIAGPPVRRGFRIGQQLQSYSILQLLEDHFGLPRLRNARCNCTDSLGPSFVPPGPVKLYAKQAQLARNFAINWTRPAVGLEPAKVHASICAVGGGCSSVVHRVRRGKYRWSGLRAAGPGQYSVKVWFEDRFGNGDINHASNAVNLSLGG
jgi:hypothetical protein